MLMDNISSQPTTSGGVLSATQTLVDCCISGKQPDQRIAATTLEDIMARADDIKSLVQFYGATPKTKTKSRREDDETKNLFKGIELAEDDLAIIILCRVANVLISDSSTSKTAGKRHRRLIKLDSCSAIIRGLRSRFRFSTSGGVSPLSDAATDALASLLLALGSKDNRLTLKIRVGGLIQHLCAQITGHTPMGESPTLLRLLCRAVRSPRNGQLAGRQKDFPQNLVNRIMELSDLDFTAGTRDLELLRLARFAEILYFISKNRKTRLQLIQEGVVSRIFVVLRRLLETRVVLHDVGGQREFSESVANEICLVTVALLRVLANNKKAKEELVAQGAVTLSERMLAQLAEEGNTANTRQLQDSLCALCLRCLPLVPFPLIGKEFPIQCPLPRPASPKRRNGGDDSFLSIFCPGSFSKSPHGKGPAASPGKTKQQEDTVSSDDDGMDEEDEVFFAMDNTPALRSDVEEEKEDEQGGRNRTISHSRLKSTELAEYDAHFMEYRQSTSKTQPAPWAGFEDTLLKNVQATSSVIPFVKVAYPELGDPDVDLPKQPLSLNRDSMKEMVVQHLAKCRSNLTFTKKIVYDLDEIFSGCGPMRSKSPIHQLACNDISRIGILDDTNDHLVFESRFESGNLRRATQVAPNHYELILSPDINQVGHHYQWFYYSVANIRAGVEYTFEIVNCLKSTSMFSKGMQPVMYSVRDAMSGRPGWIRTGDSVCYYRNLYTSDPDNEDGEKAKKRHFFSIRFHVTFRNDGDICYFAYHFPYTHSYLKTTLDRCLSRLQPQIYSRKDAIGRSVGGNPIHMLTVTGSGTMADIGARQVIVISARVHPGESNASWMMHGILDQLLCRPSSENADLLSQFVLKIIPMLNPDGVVNGSHRCSLAGVDLNRVWNKPNQTIHPEIFHSKGIIQYLVEVLERTPYIFIDLHGHSRRSNVFVFGNNPEESYRSADKALSHNYEFMSLPEMLEEVSPSFSYKNCQFNITRGKESSARVTLWRQFGIVRTYTMESTYCGYETGAYRGYQIGTRELKEMGTHLLKAMVKTKLTALMKEKPAKKILTTPKKSSIAGCRLRDLGE